MYRRALEEGGYARKTISIYVRYVECYAAWLRDEGVEILEARRQELLAYIRHLQSVGHSAYYINRVLRSIRHYYSHMLECGNPAHDVQLRGEQVKLWGALLERRLLDEAYESYEVLDAYGCRDKCMLGVLVYQGLTTGELERLEVGDVDMSRGRLRVVGSRWSNGRYLDLEGRQMLLLDRYVRYDRPRLVALALGKRGCESETENMESRMFFSSWGGHGLGNTLKGLFRKLRLDYEGIDNAQVIRRAVIVSWLKRYSLRRVQYMAGHKRVASTQRYCGYDRGELGVLLVKYHPLG